MAEGGTPDSVALNVALSPSVAMGMTYMAMADSLALVMSNAAANQQRGQLITQAAVTQALALILAKGAS
jgi:hypothetical protein